MRGRVNEVGGDDSRGGGGGRVETAPVQRGRGGRRWWKRCSEVAVATVSRWRRRGGVLVVAESVEPGCRGHVEVAGSGSRGNGAASETATTTWPAYTRVSGRPGGLGARMLRGVRAMGGGLDDEGDTVRACTG
ncbi:hypothetical protein EDB84DRAFT_1681298 [Lactarius hengduanensis]|nr:hypothetical protein EDB84DRAFT_1681298 [Lactarius hengduanensis]